MWEIILVQREMEGVKGPVCVAGGTGFIGSWLIMRLLDHGYSVQTTVRSASSGASKRPQIFNADLSDPQSFNAPIEGCTGVFHVATPIDFEDKEPEEIVTKRAIDGVLGVLQACLNSKTVKRVVYTSSGTDVVLNSDAQEVDEMDESFRSDVDFLKASHPSRHSGSYNISKTLTERATLEYEEKHGLDVVTLIPSFVVGPFICPKFPSSVRTMLTMVLGDKDQYSLLLNTSLVHIDDLASAHIFLLECPTTKRSTLKEIRGYKIPSLSTKKLLGSGFKYKYGINEMFDGAIQCCKEKGYL
ncbi:hypothetical protein FH972_001730 [Carpinus fangiana]|uniref:NAD-dependent epimerase/dehydratase domain-containing protein n=1 Tax=Carpinus fangiana TaxID=176857 RepID=A0A5N6QFU3_9ROSI|nr:hypothetical protein FH972_001730 [Carpinus fangiana]